MDAGQVEDWLERYGRAWEARDPGAAEALFAEDATYRETPFAEPLRGAAAVREYWADVTDPQEDVRFGYELLAVTGELAIALWTSTFTRVPGGERAELDGVFVLRFGDDGLCRELREWWHAR
jgi:ketosteroid isomerase-like protein